MCPWIGLDVGFEIICGFGFVFRYGFKQAWKTFKIAWDPEFPREIAFEIFNIKPTPITLINQVLSRKLPLKKQNTVVLDSIA